MNAIVTGAGRYNGIGAAICYRLAKAGHNLLFTSNSKYDLTVAHINPDDYQAIKNRCISYGANVSFHDCDFAIVSSIKEMFDVAENELGAIDLLINCACWHEYDTFGEITAEQLDMCYSVNARSVFLSCQEFAVRYNGTHGRIINLTSTQEKEPLMMEIAYAATKAMIPTLTATLAPLLFRRGITINAINPGPTDIGIADDAYVISQSKLPLGHIGSPENVADLIELLIDEKANWITGQTIHSEGGLIRNCL